MNIERSRCSKCNGDVLSDTGYCPRCADSLNFLQKSDPAMEPIGQDSAKKLIESSYVMQIVSSGVRPDSVYEAQMLLAPEVDLSSIKITVKGSNLRVNVSKPLSDQIANQLPRINEKSVLGDLVRRTMKHCENLLIPEGIDNGKPAIMEKSAQHCQSNAITVKQNEYMNFEMLSNGLKMSFRFEKVPNFYTIDDKEFYAAEMKMEGLKVGTATLVTEGILNLKLHSSEDLSYVRNLNFLIPSEANAKEVSIEVLNDTIFMRAPLVTKRV